MSKAREAKLGLRIDAKYNRISVHRATLKAIGNPEFVSLGIHPKSRKLVVLASTDEAKDAICVRCVGNNPFFIHSKALLDGIRMVAPQIGTQNSYLLRGNVLKKPVAAAFDMNDIVKTAEAE